MNCSDRGLALIKEFEGLATEVYNDTGGRPTVGYGHLIRKTERFGKVTEEEATRLLCSDLREAEACVSDCVEVPLTQNQFDALCSFVFNLGCQRLLTSTLLRELNAGHPDLASREFPKWCRVGYKAVDGLMRRRLAEQLLFNTP